jgi:hypothetical protein
MNPPIPQFDKRHKFVLLGVALTGMLIRILDGIHTPVFMDELPILYNVAHFLNEKTLTPIHFSYPTFFSYLVSLPIIITFSGLYFFHQYPLSGLSDGAWLEFIFHQFRDSLIMSGRAVSLIAFCVILWLMYRLARRFFGFIPLLISFAFLSFDPLGGRFVAYSRYALPDVTAALWVTLGFLCCLHYLETCHCRWLWAASFVIGLAISTKYNAGMAVVPLVLTLLIRPPRQRGKIWLQVTGFGILGLFAGSPAMLWAAGQYIRGYIWESRHMADGHLGANDIDYWWVAKALWNYKTMMLPVILVTLIFRFVKHRTQDWVFLAFILSSFMIIGRFEKKAMHYFIFLMPVLALFIGLTMNEIWQPCHRSKWASKVFILITAALFFIYPGYRIMKMTHRDLQPDNRLLAESWVRENIQPESRLLLDPLSMQNLISIGQRDSTINRFVRLKSPFVDQVRAFYARLPVYRIENIRCFWDNRDLLNPLETDYVIVSSQNFERFFTEDRNRWPDPGTALYAQFIRRREFYEYLFSSPRCALVMTFKTMTGPEVRIYRMLPPIVGQGTH